jgi:ketosteroid isomerase-like protein
MPSVEFLKAFAAAWNAHDLDQIMESMTDECVFRASDGAEARGKVAVRAVFQEVLQSVADIRFSDDEHFASGDRGLSEWTLSGTDADDGSSIQARGCDLFRFRAGKIDLKDTFLK